jgi:hypothetical protein
MKRRLSFLPGEVSQTLIRKNPKDGVKLALAGYYDFPAQYERLRKLHLNG